MTILPTSNSWWIFDIENSRFRRIPRDLDPQEIVPNCDWQYYADLEINTEDSSFVVFLNDEHTNIMRGYLDEDEYNKSFEEVSVANNI